jgi:hypothetical protein
MGVSSRALFARLGSTHRRFYINLPTGGAAAAVIFFCLNLNPRKGKTFREHAASFDFIGLFLITGAIASLTFLFE